MALEREDIQDLIDALKGGTKNTKQVQEELSRRAKTIEQYKKLIREKMTPGFWNEFLDENGIYFIFKLESGDIKEYTLSHENEQEIDNLIPDDMKY